LALILTFSSGIYADQVVMTNGDRLTGKIIKKDGDSIILETEAAGTVKIRWAAVERIVSDEPLSLTLDDGKIIQGKIQTEADKLNIVTPEAGKVSVDKQSVKILRTPQEQAKFEAEQRRLRESRLTDFWSGTLDAGFSLTQGNSKTRTFTGGVRGVRETPRNKLSVYASALQVKNSTSGKKVTTAQSVWTGARYDLNLNRKWFGFGSADFEYNKPQKLNLRAVIGGGAGYRAVQTDKTSLDFTFGGTHNYENFSTGLRRHSMELIFGEEAKHKLSSRVRLVERFVFYPNLSRPGNFRSLLDASLQTDINSWLGMHMTVGNRYNSQPVTATKKNDFLLSTGLRVSFGKNRKKLK
jgi:putative salt-induced outer membrane protein YdiY